MYVMHRRGWLNTTKPTTNQCKAEGHAQYHYHIIVACSETLDEQKFIIDHNDIHNAMRKLRIQGSCEEIHKKLYRQALRTFKATNTILYLYKCILSPTVPNGEAYLEYIKVNKDVPLPDELQFISL